MSHFTVMVVGDDVDYQLAPFHEFECTGYDDEFVVNVDKLSEAKAEFEKSEQMTLAEFIEYYYGAKIIEGDAEPDLTETHKYGWCRVKDGEVIEYIDRTNPNKEKYADGDGNIFAYSSHGKGLQFVQANTPGNRVLCDDEAGLVSLVQALHEAAKQGEQDHNAAPEMASQEDVWAFPERVQRDVGFAGRVLQNLQGAIGTEDWRLFCRSLSFDWDSSVDPLHELQHLARTCERQGLHFAGHAGLFGPVSCLIVGGKKWDWYSIGGRWSGMLVLKNGSKANQARKSEIDFEAMRNGKGNEAAAEWDKMKTARDASNTGDTWEPWDKMVETAKKLGESIDDARGAYWKQPAIVAMKAVNGFRWGGLDCFLSSREDYIDAARNRSASTFAFLKDRQWAEKGSMGWFGMSDDKMTQDDWNAWITAQIEALPDDALITIVDCHI